MINNTCRHCQGRGKATYTKNSYYDYEETCHVCKGTGRNDTVVLTKEKYERLTGTRAKLSPSEQVLRSRKNSKQEKTSRGKDVSQRG